MMITGIFNRDDLSHVTKGTKFNLSGIMFINQTEHLTTFEKLFLFLTTLFVLEELLF